MPVDTRTLDQQIEDARRILDARVAKRRKLQDRGRYIIATLLLKTAENDSNLDKRIREVVARGVKNDRDRAAVEAILGSLGKSQDGRHTHDGGDTLGEGHGVQDPGSDDPHGGGSY